MLTTGLKAIYRCYRSIKDRTVSQCNWHVLLL